MGSPESRQMRIAKNTLAPVITDGFIKVCCRAQMKVCQNTKLNLQWHDERLGEQARDTRYDAKNTVLL